MDNPFKITHLPFDSSLFGYPVGKFVVENSWDEEAFLVEAKNFNLVYIFSKNPLNTNSRGISHADTKLTFEKKLLIAPSNDSEVTAYTGNLSEQLLALAMESGIYSRFNTDPMFKKGEFQKLYRLWIQKGLENGEVLVTADFAGFISCHVGEGTAQIGLIAVDEKHRGRGVGKKMLQAAESKAIQRGAKTLSVATQTANLPACNLYQKLGYTLKEKVFIYHYWRV